MMRTQEIGPLRVRGASRRRQSCGRNYWSALETWLRLSLSLAAVVRVLVSRTRLHARQQLDWLRHISANSVHGLDRLEACV